MRITSTEQAPKSPLQLSQSLQSEISFSQLLSSPPVPAQLDPTPATEQSINGHDQANLGQNELKEAFQDFVGQTFFGQMLQAYRKTQQPSAYFHGGRAEEIFQGQLDQVLTEEISKSSAEKISDPMFELFMLKRSQ